jgi:leucyl aminopeptidase
MVDVASVRVVPRGHEEADLFAAGCFEGEAPEVEGAAEGLRAAALRLSALPGWTGREEQLAHAELRPGGPMLALYGLGKGRDFSVQDLAAWLARVAEAARGARRVVVVLPRHAETAGAAVAERVLRTLALSPYRYDTYQSERRSDPPPPQELAVAPPPGLEAAFRGAARLASVVAGGVALARGLANTPPNEASPAWMEERAREIAASRGMEVAVLDADELARRGMGGILAVGASGAVPPRLVRLAWGTEGPVISLVGKGVTFDSGGISIKPAADMDDMKYDKAGACAVLGAARAVADLGLPVRLRAYLPFAENMLGSRAYRPGDILRLYNGKTVEITNTDAEGRLILADALAWAAEEGADALVELSTLTGHCVVALGHQAAGLFTPDDALAAALTAAGAAGGERLWRMPLYPEFLDEMKGRHADLRNAAGRPGGASTAAAFLSQFVGGLSSWAHLDIAGMASVKADQDAQAVGATGFGVATLVHWIQQRAASTS